MANLKYWIWLASNSLLNPAKVVMLIDTFGGPEQVANADRKVLESLGWLSAGEISSLMRRDFGGAERILQDCVNKQISILTIQDAAYPERLRNIPDPPAVLYYKGRLPDFDAMVTIAVVGTRSCTNEGCRIAEKLSTELSRNGAYVVSGIAKGIDSAAHVGALKAGCGTSALLGCGCDVVYPAENRKLYEQVSRVGALISEYPPGTRPFGSNFPRRNRIMSGISKGVLVVQAGKRSGALITARLALEQGRDVFAVPGAFGAPESMGTNLLIRDSAAKLVTCVNDILCEYEPLLTHVSTQRFAVHDTGEKWRGGQSRPEPETESVTEQKESEKRIKVDRKKIKDFTERQLDIILSIAESPRTAEDLTESLSLEARELLSELTMLQLMGAVKQEGALYAPVREFFEKKRDA